MQILGTAGSTSNANSRLSTTGGFAGIDAQSARRAPNSSNEMSQANSAMSFECGGDQMTSTIDLKVDVHRKNSSESSDSLTEQCSGGIDPNGSKKSSHLSSSVQTQNAEVCQTVDYRRKSMKTKSKSEDASATATNIIKEGGGIGSDLMTRSEERRDKFVDMENSAGNRCESHKRRMRWKLQRQASQSVATCPSSLVPNTNIENELNFRRSTSSRLQRHRSSDSNDERRRHHRSHHHGLFNPGSALQSMPTEMIYMNSSMSAIQLPTASMGSGSSTNKQPTDPVDKLNSESESDDDDGDDDERDDEGDGDDKFKNSENGVYTVFEFRKRCIHRFRAEKQQTVADTAYTDFDDEMGAVGGAQPSTSSTATTATTTTTNTKSEDSGCPSSDCEQASASSKDMLLSREQKPVPSDRHSGEFVYMEPIVSSAAEASAKAEDDGNDGDDNVDKAIFATTSTKRQSEESKGAIPKTHLCHYDHTDESTSAAAVAAAEASGASGALMVSGTNESENQKKKSLRRSFSSLSIRSGCDPMAVEVFRQLYEEMLEEERQTSQ